MSDARKMSKAQLLSLVGAVLEREPQSEDSEESEGGEEIAIVAKQSAVEKEREREKDKIAELERELAAEEEKHKGNPLLEAKKLKLAIQKRKDLE